jgi:hypothetical protein
MIELPVCEECLAKILVTGIIPPPAQHDLTAKQYLTLFSKYCFSIGINTSDVLAEKQFYKGLSDKSKEVLPAIKGLPTIVDTVNLLTAIEDFEHRIFGCQKDTT